MDKKILALLNWVCLCIYATGLPATSSLQDITVKKCGTSILPPSSPDRIVGGNTALHGQYPWMISLQGYDGKYGFEHLCGAAILNENWIITAAHCIILNPEELWRYRILAGLHNVSEEYAPTVQRIRVSKIVVHEDFERSISGKDIALVKTAEPIDIAGSKGYVNAICFPKTDEDPKGYATVTGWGHTSEGGNNSDTLREVVVPLIPRDICYEPFYNYHEVSIPVTSTMICAGVTGKDSCQNDSGGPLFQTNRKGESTLIGITSFGIGCADKNYPGVYTKVSSYQSWIENIMATY